MRAASRATLLFDISLVIALGLYYRQRERTRRQGCKQRKHVNRRRKVRCRAVTGGAEVNSIGSGVHGKGATLWAAAPGWTKNRHTQMKDKNTPVDY